MSATRPASLWREPPLALLGATALAQAVLLASLAAGGHRAKYAFFAGAIAVVGGGLLLLALVHVFALARRAGRGTVGAYLGVSLALAAVALAGPFLAERAREAGALRSIERVGIDALRREGRELLVKYRSSGMMPVQIAAQEMGPAILGLEPMRVVRFGKHLKVRLYGLEDTYWGVWILEPGWKIDAPALGEGVYWVRADEAGYLGPMPADGSPVGSAGR